MPNARWNRPAGSKLRDQAQINEGQLELRGFACVNKVAVRQHGGSASDSCSLYGCDQWLVEVDQRILEKSLRTFTGPWRILEKVFHIVTGTEGISQPMPEHDTNAGVPRSVIEKICQSDVHGRSHGVFLCRTI